MSDEASQAARFWNFNIGHAITIFMLVISVIGMFFKIDNRLDIVEKIEKFNMDKLTHMDELGTRASREGIFKDTELNKSNTARVDRLEHIINELAPKIERVDTNLQWLLKTTPGTKKPNQE